MNKSYKINSDMHVVMIPPGNNILGVVGDSDVTKIFFTMHKEYGDIDLSEFNICINYINENEEVDTYIVEDKNISGDNLMFSWLVGAKACAVAGYTRFTICFRQRDSNGDILREYNTKLCKMKVLEGCEIDESTEEGKRISDVVKQYAKLEADDSEGRIKIAAAITRKKVPTESTDDWDTMAANIDEIKLGRGEYRIGLTELTTSLCQSDEYVLPLCSLNCVAFHEEIKGTGGSLIL